MDTTAGARAELTDADVRWLDADEQLSWRGFISGVTALHDELERELLGAHDISMDDYAILVLLSEAPDRALRMSAIADATLVPRPQVTYRVTRLEKAGVVARRPAPDDARGKQACLTDAGFALLQRAARTHVTNVRQLFLDHVTADEFAVLGSAMARVHAAIAQGADPLRA
jgi:DNA-binding MarR family transcriptional regulator